MKSLKPAAALVAAVLSLFLAACRSSPPAGGTGTPPPDTGPTQTATSFQPPSSATVEAATSTPVPLALIVNGEPVTLDEFNAAVRRFHAGLPEIPSEEAVRRVMDEYISQILLAQAAAEAGFILEPGLVEARLSALMDEIGGEEALEAWIQANEYTHAWLEADLERGLAAAWMRDRILAEVPTEAEQVRARHVRLSSREEAESVLAQLNNGTAFDILVLIYDPEGLGELGWFPRGYLLEPVLEEAAFGLQVGDHSGVLETGVGFHILEVTGREADRPLSPDALWALQQQHLADWLADRRSEAEIEQFVP